MDEFIYLIQQSIKLVKSIENVVEKNIFYSEIIDDLYILSRDYVFENIDFYGFTKIRSDTFYVHSDYWEQKECLNMAILPSLLTILEDENLDSENIQKTYELFCFYENIDYEYKDRRFKKVNLAILKHKNCPEIAYNENLEDIRLDKLLYLLEDNRTKVLDRGCEIFDLLKNSKSLSKYKKLKNSKISKNEADFILGQLKPDYILNKETEKEIVLLLLNTNFPKESFKIYWDKLYNDFRSKQQLYNNPLIFVYLLSKRKDLTSSEILEIYKKFNSVEYNVVLPIIENKNTPYTVLTDIFKKIKFQEEKLILVNNQEMNKEMNREIFKEIENHPNFNMEGYVKEFLES